MSLLKKTDRNAGGAGRRRLNSLKGIKWRGTWMSRQTTIFFATDIHGSERCFMKFINAAKFYQAEVLILGGDITGKAMVPIVRQLGGAGYRATFLGSTTSLETEEALTAFERQVRHSGAYPFRTT